MVSALGYVLALGCGVFVTVLIGGVSRPEVTEATSNVPQQMPRAVTSELSPGFLHQLLAMPQPQLAGVDIARMNLLCAVGLPGSENLDVDRCLRTLDEWAVHAQSEIARHLYRFQRDPERYNNSEAYFRIEMMVTVLQEDCGVHYNKARDRNVDFTNARDLFIHGMVRDAKGGTCVSMPVLYTAVARRLGYPVKLVTADSHLFCRWDSPKERFNIEATNRGVSVFEDEYYKTWPVKVSDAEVAANGYLQSLTPAQELAQFLCARAHCLKDNGSLHEAQVAYAEAHRLHPESRLRLLFLAESVSQELRELDGLSAAERGF